MAKIHYKPTGQVHNIKRLKAWAILGWSVALVLSVIMSRGVF